ncbi:MAG: hypothetical protein SGBAC_009470 [Bacillariaceae sp.]
MAPYDYAGEEFLSVDLPDYETDRTIFVVKLVVAFVSWLVVLPVLMSSSSTSSKSSSTTTKTKEEEEKETSSTTTTVTHKNGTTRRTKTIKIVETTTKQNNTKKQVNGKSKKAKQKAKEAVKDGSDKKHKEEESPPSPPPPVAVTEVSELANVLCIIGFLATFCYMIVVASPDNAHTTRGVFEAPLFTRDECNYLVDMAETVAQRNYQTAAASDATNATTMKDQDLILMEPIGWQKKRHQIHSTTDLNVITDPFSKQDRQWINQKLNSRLAPTIERLYGVPQGSIRANDIFVIRYDGDRQASLNPHTDDGDVTFSALLSDGFTGGGTNYYNRHDQYYHEEGNSPYQPQPHEVFAHVLPEIGQMTLFRSSITHEGVQVTKGRRYLLIGFLNIDNVDPWTSKPTGLSWLASWFSLNWAAVRFKAGYSSAVMTNAKLQDQKNEEDDWMTAEETKHGDWMSESTYIRGLFIQFQLHLTLLADFTSTHFFQSIIPANQTKPFLETMDEAYALRKASNKSPSWFSGQQVDLSIGGSFYSEWSTRARNSKKFDQEEI